MQVLHLQRKNLPLGCYRYRGSPSSQRVQELKKNLQIERQSAYGQEYQSNTLHSSYTKGTLRV